MTTNRTLLVTLAQPNEDEIEIFQGYVGASTELALEAGAEVSSRFPVRHVQGDAPAVVFGLASFPSTGAVTAMFEGDAYQRLVPDRDKGLDGVNAYVVDPAPLTALAAPDGVYLITVAAPNPDAGDDLTAYQKVAGPLSAKHGAVPVANLPVVEHPVGDTPAAFVGIASFPSQTAVEEFLTDPDYLPIVPTRDRALRSLNLYVTTDR